MLTKSQTFNYLKDQYIFRLFCNIFTMISEYFIILKKYVIKYSPNTIKDEVIYFDFETTGLNPYHNKIIEYCFLIEDEDESQISDIVDPEEKIEKKITDITGIHPDMFENKQNIDYHIEDIYNFINGTYKNSIFRTDKKYLVAHNAIGFDSIFLERELSKAKDLNKNITTKNFVYVDTLLLARKLLPELKSHTLSSLANHYEVSTGTHRALSDVLCLKNVYMHLLKELGNKQKLSYSYYIEYPQEVVNYYSF